MIEATEVWDVGVNPDLGTGTALDLDAVAALPGTVQLWVWIGDDGATTFSY